MKRLLVITPHLSTGGAPQVTANKIKLIEDDFDIMVIEHAFVAWKFVVQRNRIIETVGESKFKSLGENKFQELKSIVETFNPDVISMEEFPEMFLSEDCSRWLYRKERSYTILETTHDSSFNPAHKRFFPDKFVFVSPYNALKYKHLKIPFEIIEYPVDLKKQDKAKYRSKLNLDAGFKHVVIIGLFTPRKNQKYAFELCHKLADYKIKFHFLGNQAENFGSYWQPLMEWKAEDERLNNCVVWGERDDTEDFLKAVDLFLFPSKGDRGNKELNPIVIKEALEYEDLPKLMYNLDVYLNRYNNIKNMNYLTGNLDEDAKKVLELTQAKHKDNTEELIVIGTYPNLKSRVQLTKDTINSLKPLGRKILLISHYPVDFETQQLVDYYIFDSNNPLCHHSYYTRFYRSTNEYHAEVNINGLKYSNQSLTVLVNLFTATKFAKDLGFKSFFYSTYDVIISESDIPAIETGFEEVKTSNAYLGSLNTPFGKGIQTNGMFFNTDFFLSTFDDVNNSDDYNRACEKAGCQNFLEDYLVKKLNGKPNVKIIHNKEETLLKSSGLGVASNSEYYSILPVEGKDNEFMFYFFTYNVDDRMVNVIMKEEDSEFYNFRFQISKTREFKKGFKFSGKPIEVLLEFYDDQNLYKKEKYVIKNNNLSKYKETGFYKILNERPKVKVVHIQTTLNDEKEVKSRDSLKKIADFGIEYVVHQNTPYTDLPPKFNCQRPQCVSMELFDHDTVQKLGTALTPSHYGCFEAFKNAILSEFDDCDFLIVCEGDCIVERPMDEFVSAIFKAAELLPKNNIGYFSFGDTKTLEFGWHQSPVIQEIPNQDLLFITNHIIGIQSIMFPKFAKDWLKQQLRTHKWDASDIFFNQIFRNSPYRMGIVKSRFTTQADGYSLIDKQHKTFR